MKIQYKGIANNIIALLDPRSPITEAYRMLRTNLYFSGIDTKNQIIEVTSSDQAEGKTTTTINLALTLAQDGKKVLLIDCDLRKPRVHRYFYVDNHMGLTNLIVEGYEHTDIYYESDDLPSLHLVASGPLPPNPSEILGSKKMADYLNSLRSMYDYIIVDTPPVGRVTDGVVLAPVVDGVLLTVASGQSQAQITKRAKGLLDQVGANILGVVLTKVSKKNSGYGYEAYGGYYGD